MTGSRYAMFCMYLLMIYKKTVLKGILPHCYTTELQQTQLFKKVVFDLLLTAVEDLLLAI